MFCGECGRSTGARPAQPHNDRSPETPREEPVAQTPANPAPAITLSRVSVPSANVRSDDLDEPQSAAEPDAPAPVQQREPADPEPAMPDDLEPEIIDLARDDHVDHDLATDDDVCAQCGTRFEDSDIFCAECGFVRPRPDAVPRPGDTVAFDPFPWRLPRSTEQVAPYVHVPEVAPEPAVEAIVPELAPVLRDVAPVAAEPAESTAAVTAGSSIDDAIDVEQTRIVSRSPRGDRFVLQFSTGESITVFGTGMVGRHPLAEPGEYFDTFVTIADPGKSVSNTHLEYGQDSGYFWVSDRFSGNGTVVREPESPPKRCDPGKRYRVARGTRVEIGEQFFIVS